MASLKHRLEHAVVWGTLGAARLLPGRFADGLACILAALAYHVLASRRRLAINNLNLVFRGRFSEAATRNIVKRVFRNIAQTFVEEARVPKLGVEGFKAENVGSGQDNILKAQQEGKGQIAVTAHFGNWEKMGMWAGLQGVNPAYMVYRQHNPLVNELVNRLRVTMSGTIIEIPGQIKDVFRVLRNNGMVFIVCDQHASAGTLVMDFLGRPAAVARGPALFAVRHGCPILPFLLVRERFNRHVVKAGRPIYPPHSGDEDADVRAMTASWVEFFERWIREYPDQWMWTHNRWKLPAQTPSTD